MAPMSVLYVSYPCLAYFCLARVRSLVFIFGRFGLVWHFIFVILSTIILLFVFLQPVRLGRLNSPAQSHIPAQSNFFGGSSPMPNTTHIIAHRFMVFSVYGALYNLATIYHWFPTAKILWRSFSLRQGPHILRDISVLSDCLI